MRKNDLSPIAFEKRDHCIVALLQAGLSTREVGLIFGISKQAVHQKNMVYRHLKVDLKVSTKKEIL